MAQFPSLPLWTDAYLADTTHLSTIEHGAYLLLLMAMWRSKGCRLPNDDKLLARYAGLTAGQWARIKPSIWPFFRVESDSITQGRLTDEAELVRRNSAVASDNARRRWLKNNDSDDAKASVPQSGRNATTPTTTPIDKKEGANAPLSSDAPRTLDLVPPEPDVEQSAFDAYNAMAARAGIPLAQKFDQTRRAKLRQRLKDCGGLSGWVAALEKLSKSSHCTGSNDRGWRADFDFLLQNQSFTRLMEGRYDDRKPQQPSHQPKSRIASNDEIRRRLAAAAGVKLDNGRESS